MKNSLVALRGNGLWRLRAPALETDGQDWISHLPPLLIVLGSLFICRMSYNSACPLGGCDNTVSYDTSNALFGPGSELSFNNLLSTIFLVPSILLSIYCFHPIEKSSLMNLSTSHKAISHGQESMRERCVDCRTATFELHFLPIEATSS